MSPYEAVHNDPLPTFEEWRRKYDVPPRVPFAVEVWIAHAEGELNHLRSLVKESLQPSCVNGE